MIGAHTFYVDVADAQTLPSELSYAGALTIEAPSGALDLGGRNLTLTGAATIGGALDIAAGSTLRLGGAVAGPGQIGFSSAGPTKLQLDAAAAPANGGAFAPTLANFGDNDTLDLAALSFAQGATATLNGSTLTVASGGVTETFTLSHPAATAYYAYNDGAAGTVVTDSSTPPCYVRGARILTERGEIAVEDLRVGDLAVTASGEVRPVRWLGHRQVDVARHRDPAAVRPVRVVAGAFDEGLPHRDLWLSPGHNVACEGALMPISALVNGLSVAQVEVSEVEYWHVELDAHDVILAEGLPAESYLDTGNRAAFSNGGAFVEAHPDFQPRHWAETCLPLVKQGPAVVAAKTRLLARLRERGWSIDQDANVHILVDGQRVEPIPICETRLAFALPAGGGEIALCSKTFVPAHTVAASADPRELGLCIEGLQVDGSWVALEALESGASGWHGAEYDGERFTQRWTTGATPLPAGARIVILDLAGDGYYWRAPQGAVIALSARDGARAAPNL